MKVLVTGSSGLVGSGVIQALDDSGSEAIPFDIEEGRDLLDLSSLEMAATGCQAIIHTAAIIDESASSPDQLFEVNVGGTSNVLGAASRVGVHRIVFVSSVSVLGVFKGHRHPDYLPLDLRHPCYPSTPYEESKLRGEELCSEFAQAGLGSVVSLRVPGIWTRETYREVSEARRSDPAFEWHPYWEYGAFLDVRDLAEACLRATEVDVDGHLLLMLASSDITTSGPTSLEWVKRIHPDVEWRGGERYTRHPFSSLIEFDEAREALGWEPGFTWRRYLDRLKGEGSI